MHKIILGTQLIDIEEINYMKVKYDIHKDCISVNPHLRAIIDINHNGDVKCAIEELCDNITNYNFLSLHHNTMTPQEFGEYTYVNLDRVKEIWPIKIDKENYYEIIFFNGIPIIHKYEVINEELFNLVHQNAIDNNNTTKLLLKNCLLDTSDINFITLKDGCIHKNQDAHGFQNFIKEFETARTAQITPMNGNRAIKKFDRCPDISERNIIQTFNFEEIESILLENGFVKCMNYYLNVDNINEIKKLHNRITMKICDGVEFYDGSLLLIPTKNMPTFNNDDMFKVNGNEMEILSKEVFSYLKLKNYNLKKKSARSVYNVE